MSLTKVTYSMINGATVNALDFGAVGDNTHDDTAAIQAALDTGKLVFLPKGNYKVTSTLIVPSGGGIMGEGHANWDYRFTEGTWINSSAATAIQVGTSTSFTVGANLDNFSLTKTGFTNGGSVSGTGIFYLNSYYNSSRSIYIEGFNYGLFLGNDSIAGTMNLGLTFIDTNIGGCNVCINANNCADVSFYGGRIGINGSDAARATGVLINHNVNSFSAYRLIIANNSGFSRNVQISNATTGLYWITFDNCDMETATVASVDMQPSGLVSFVRVKNCWIGSPAPMFILTGDRIIIEQNTFPSAITGNVITIGAGDVTIKNNDFLSTATGAVVAIGATNNIKIVENYLVGVVSEGILFNPESASDCGNVLISENHIYNNSDNGISIQTSSGLSNVIVTNNQIENFTNYGVRVGLGSGQTTPTKSHIRIDGNTIVAPSAGGITIADSGLDYFMIVNNDVSGCSSKITNGSAGTHNVIANNLS